MRYRRLLKRKWLRTKRNSIKRIKSLPSSILRNISVFIPGRRLKANELGIFAEIAALRYLEHKKYIPIARNWSCRWGEIDIIAALPQELIIVEVKARFDSAKLAYEVIPQHAVTKEKQRRLKLLANEYVAQNQRTIKRMKIKRIRFDVMAVHYHRGVLPPFLSLKCKHLVAAFEG